MDEPDIIIAITCILFSICILLAAVHLINLTQRVEFLETQIDYIKKKR